MPVNRKEAFGWWEEVLAEAQHEDMHVSIRACRRKERPGWYDFNAIGPGGDLFLEWALKELYRWCPGFDIEAVELPELSSDFPAQAVKDVFGNLKEWLLSSRHPCGCPPVDS